MLTGHKNLIKSTKSTWNAGGQAYEPEEEFLVVAELADWWQQLIEVEGLLQNKLNYLSTQITQFGRKFEIQFFNYLPVPIIQQLQRTTKS